MGEFERIARLTRRFPAPSDPNVGIGDDAAVLSPSSAAQVITVDASIEGVHFERAWLSLSDAMERAAEAAISDVAAMGATLRHPRSGLLFALEIPVAITEDEFDALIEGLARSAERHGAAVLGGNISRGPALACTTTAIGALLGAPMLRSGALVGDAIYTTGPLGAAALGLRALMHGKEDDLQFSQWINRWRRPQAKIEAGLSAAKWAHACVDVSDGLAQDAGHVATASGKRLALFAEAIPLLPGQVEAAVALGQDAVALALSGGEDYELLLCGPDGMQGEGLTKVGEVREGEGVVVVVDGVERPAPQGFSHA